MTSPNRSGLPGSSYDDSSDSADPLQPLTEAAMSHGEIKGILPQVLLRIRDAFRADTAVLLLADDAGKNLTVSAVVGALEQELTPGVPARLVPAKIALRNLDTLSVSLVVDSRLVGELHIGNLESHRFTAVQTKQLQGLADRLALTLDHARLYHAERAARGEAARAERRFRDLVHNLEAIVWEASLPDWRYTFVSRRAEKILGYPIARWLGTPDFWLQIVHPDDRTEVLRRRAAIQKGRRGSLEYRVRAADGRTLWMTSLFEIVRDADGVPCQIRGLMLDITQRREAEEDALRLAAIVECSDDAIFRKDLNAIIQTWNLGAQKMYGYTAAEAVGQHVTLLTPPHKRDEINGIMAKLARGERISHMETQRRRKDGEIIDVALTISPIRDATGKRIIGASTIAREISDLKRAERTLRTTEKLAATGRLAASIAHEINNPMASVTNLLYLLQHSPLDQSAAEYVRLAQEELQRVTHIVRQMLGFYRESEVPIIVNLKDVLENVLLLYARRLQTTHIRVERDLADVSIRGFPGEIRQVFSNLVVNSIEALGDNGRIRIDVRRSRDWSNLSVEGVRAVIGDDGPGIPETARRHIFEPFFTTKGERGTGLGLWVSEGIIRKHGGTLRVRSSVSPRRHGTCFSIFFPLSEAVLRKVA